MFATTATAIQSIRELPVRERALRYESAMRDFHQYADPYFRHMSVIESVFGQYRFIKYPDGTIETSTCMSPAGAEMLVEMRRCLHALLNQCLCSYGLPEQPENIGDMSYAELAEIYDQ